MSEVNYCKLSIPCDCAYLSQIRQGVHDALAKNIFHTKEAHLIALAVDEAVANVIEHGYPDCEIPKKQIIDVILKWESKKLEVRVLDHGTPFNLTTVSTNVDLRQYVRDGRKGGLGIFLIKKIMDEVHYSSKLGEPNELRMIKYIDNPSRES